MAGRHPTRRQCVLGATVGPAALAGCLGGSGGGSDGGEGTDANDLTPTDGETVRLVGFPEIDAPSFQAWLPCGPADDQGYYPFEMDTLASILTPDGDEGTVTFCNEAVVTAAGTVRESPRPTPGTTIDDV